MKNNHVYFAEVTYTVYIWYLLIGFDLHRYIPNISICTHTHTHTHTHTTTHTHTHTHTHISYFSLSSYICVKHCILFLCVIYSIYIISLSLSLCVCVCV